MKYKNVGLCRVQDYLRSICGWTKTEESNLFTHEGKKYSNLGHN